MRIESPLFSFFQWKQIPFQTETTSPLEPKSESSPPKVVPLPPEIVAVSGGGDVVDESASMKAKHDALQRKGVAAMIVAEEYARRLESSDVVVSFVQL